MYETRYSIVLELPNLKGDCWQGAQCANCDRGYVGSLNGVDLCCQNCERKGLRISPNTCYCNHESK